MSVSSSSGTPKTDEKPYLRFFHSMNLGSVAKISRYFPRKISLAVGAFSLIARFAFLKFDVLRDYFFQNQQKKPIEKTPIIQPVQTEVKQPAQPELIRPESKPVEIESKIQPTITSRKAARTWEQRREQLLSTKI